MARPEKHGMRGWGVRMGADPAEPRTLEEAQLTAMMTIADRLLEMNTALGDLQMRLQRIEIWLEERAPGYARTSAYASPILNPGAGPRERHA